LNDLLSLDAAMPEQPNFTRDVARFGAFSDGVMVVSMTLLILNVQLPDTASTPGVDNLYAALVANWTNYLGYILSFIVTAQYWMGYTAYFGRMRAVDDRFAWLNILFLLVVGFIPFVTAVITKHEDALATSLYAATMILVALLLIGMSLYATRNGLLQARFAPHEWWKEVEPWLQIAAVFGASIVVAHFAPRYARLVWLFLAVPLRPRLGFRSKS
jgi:uncharacterized membrane protein